MWGAQYQQREPASAKEQERGTERAVWVANVVIETGAMKTSGECDVGGKHGVCDAVNAGAECGVDTSEGGKGDVGGGGGVVWATQTRSGRVQI